MWRQRLFGRLAAEFGTKRRVKTIFALQSHGRLNNLSWIDSNGVITTFARPRLSFRVAEQSPLAEPSLLVTGAMCLGTEAVVRSGRRSGTGICCNSRIRKILEFLLWKCFSKALVDISKCDAMRRRCRRSLNKVKCDSRITMDGRAVSANNTSGWCFYFYLLPNELPTYVLRTLDIHAMRVRVFNSICQNKLGICDPFPFPQSSGEQIIPNESSVCAECRLPHWCSHCWPSSVADGADD